MKPKDNATVQTHKYCSLSVIRSFRNANRKARNGFTLLELSVVVLIMALLAGAALRYAATTTDAKNLVTLNATLDAIDAAMMNFRIANNRLPCPTDITLAENTANFGQEAGYSTTNTGQAECVSGSIVSGNITLTPTANFENTGTDPDAAGGSDDNYSGSADPLYDSASLNKIEAGGVPTKALRLPDKYAYDPWGRKILYVVDKRITATSAFTSYPAYALGASTVGEVVVKPTNTGTNSSTSANTLGNAVTYSALYALVSSGKNGHGGYVRSLSATAQRFNAGSNDPDELKNCHCTAAAASGTFDRIFVQKPKANSGTGNLTDVFDDIVRYKTRAEMAAPSELQ